MARTISDSQILEAALDVIAQHGYAGATTRQIAAAAGINAVTLFRRFGSKQALLKAAVEQQVARFSASRIEYTGDVEADLLGVVHFYHDIVQRRGRMITMLINEIPRQPELLEILQTPLAIAGGVIALIARYQQEGVLVAEQPMQAYAALVGPVFLQGIFGSVEIAAFAGSFSAEAHVRRYLQGWAACAGRGPAGRPRPAITPRP